MKLLLQFTKLGQPSNINCHQLLDDKKHLEETVAGWKETSKISDPVITENKLTYKLNGSSHEASISQVPDDYQSPTEA